MAVKSGKVYRRAIDNGDRLTRQQFVQSSLPRLNEAEELIAGCRQTLLSQGKQGRMRPTSRKIRKPSSWSALTPSAKRTGSRMCFRQ